ncbi:MULTISPECIES: lysoplasmalogenase family protein [unclassified Gordonia (in: high G+C Gram-positive bacteria)]|uniref:lysoplasmalogenase family protein n=2 Tax=unclassified Gordonia (in: high G+C Gram-positive bacteria) TaxID=2657482 RepID=UPI003D945563
MSPVGPRWWRALGVASYATAAAAATFYGATGPRRAAAMTKPVPLALLGGYVAAGYRRRTPLDTALLTAIVAASAAGDRLMLLEEFETDQDAKDRYLRWGASVFGAAQLSYAAAMLRAGARPTARLLAPRLAILTESAVVMAVHRPRLLTVLGPYGQSLALMSALAADVKNPQPRMRIGGWLFLASDLTILNRRHLITDQRVRTAAEVWVLATYFAAQALLVSGLDKLSRD